MALPAHAPAHLLPRACGQVIFSGVYGDDKLHAMVLTIPEQGLPSAFKDQGYRWYLDWDVHQESETMCAAPDIASPLLLVGTWPDVHSDLMTF